jgi:hypothetical protein
MRASMLATLVLDTDPVQRVRAPRERTASAAVAYPVMVTRVRSRLREGAKALWISAEGCIPVAAPGFSPSCSAQLASKPQISAALVSCLQPASS